MGKMSNNYSEKFPIYGQNCFLCASALCESTGKL